jgi:hypothetical protein
MGGIVTLCRLGGPIVFNNGGHKNAPTGVTNCAWSLCYIRRRQFVLHRGATVCVTPD